MVLASPHVELAVARQQTNRRHEGRICDHFLQVQWGQIISKHFLQEENRMLVTYQAVPKKETTQTGVQYDLHIFELRIPLDSKTDATGPTDIVFHPYSGFIFHADNYRPTVCFWYLILHVNT